jgi:hypothetical protein
METALLAAQQTRACSIACCVHAMPAGGVIRLTDG